MKKHTEARFEDAIIEHLLSKVYKALYGSNS